MYKVFKIINYFYYQFFKYISLQSYIWLTKKLDILKYQKEFEKKNINKEIILLDGIWENYDHFFRLFLVFRAIKGNCVPVAIIKKIVPFLPNYILKP